MYTHLELSSSSAQHHLLASVSSTEQHMLEV